MLGCASTGTDGRPLGVMTDQRLSSARLRLLPSEPGAGTSQCLHLVRLLETLGDEASRFACLEDARWHIVSCRAHHVATAIAASVGWPAPGDGCLVDGSGIGVLVRSIGDRMAAMPGGVLDAWCASEVDRLLPLALAVSR